MEVELYTFDKGGMIPFDGEGSFPPLELALDDPNGLLAIGGEPTPELLLEAYRRGIFPWYGDGDPTMWWSPDPRMVLFPKELKISRSLRKRMRRNDYEVRFDSAFRDVIKACATMVREHEKGTWITDEILNGYCALHESGYAHSVEIWINGELAGGLYGVRIGRVFYGESMFHRISDASKIAFVHLVERLRQDGVELIDCQMNTKHLASFGAREIPREEFVGYLDELI